VPQGKEFASIQQAYDQSTIDSQRAVTSKQTDCPAAVRHLVDLKRAITSRLATAGTGAPRAARAGTVATLPRPSGDHRDCAGRPTKALSVAWRCGSLGIADLFQ
jgi:hypothetical protein